MATEIHEEMIVELKNEPGALARVLQALAAAGVNVLAFVGYNMGPAAGLVHVVADHPGKAKAALDAAKAKYSLHPALFVKVDDKPGSAAAVFGKIAAKGINVEHCYASGMGSGQGKIVILTSDNGKAKEALGG